MKLDLKNHDFKFHFFHNQESQETPWSSKKDTLEVIQTKLVGVIDNKFHIFIQQLCPNKFKLIITQRKDKSKIECPLGDKYLYSVVSNCFSFYIDDSEKNIVDRFKRKISFMHPISLELFIELLEHLFEVLIDVSIKDPTTEEYGILQKIYNYYKENI